MSSFPSLPSCWGFRTSETRTHLDRSAVLTNPSTVGNVIATTLEIYGVTFVVLFLLYIYFRPLYDAAYNARGFHEVNNRMIEILG